MIAGKIIEAIGGSTPQSASSCARSSCKAGRKWRRIGLKLSSWGDGLMEITLHPSHDQNLVLKPMIQAMFWDILWNPNIFIAAVTAVKSQAKP